MLKGLFLIIMLFANNIFAADNLSKLQYSVDSEGKQRWLTFTVRSGLNKNDIKSRAIGIWDGDSLIHKIRDLYQKDTIYLYPGEFNLKHISTEGLKVELITETKKGQFYHSNTVYIDSSALNELRKGLPGDSTLERYFVNLFDFDDFGLNNYNKKILDDYVIPRIKNESSVVITGHNDYIGLYDYNKTLSCKRAEAVYKYILQQLKCDSAEISRDCVGEDDPLYDNALTEGRFYNRTVKIEIRTAINNPASSDRSLKVR